METIFPNSPESDIDWFSGLVAFQKPLQSNQRLERTRGPNSSDENLLRLKIKTQVRIRKNREKLEMSNEEMVASRSTRVLTHLDRLEAESIHIMREVMAHAENPVMLYSIGKDSSVMLHLARKAFYPSIPPFPLLHVDTRWKFKAMYEFREKMVEESGMELLVHNQPRGCEEEY